MTVHYLLKSDFCFTFPIKFKFKDFALHLPCNFVEAKYAPLHTLFSSTVVILISFPACRGHFRPQRPRYFWSAPRIASEFLSMRRDFISYSQPIRFVRLDSEYAQSDMKFVIRGFLVLDFPRDRYSWFRPKGARPLGTRMFDGRKV